MSKPSWIRNLNQILNHLQQAGQRPRVAVVGIGHELRGDDAAGIAVVKRLKVRIGDSDEWPDDPHRPVFLLIEAGPAPENASGRLRTFRPNLIILVDAANLNTIPGTVRWISWQFTAGLTASTHTLPVHMFARYLVHELDAKVGLLCIQAATNTIGLPLSTLVQQAVVSITHELEAILTQRIAALSPHTIEEG